MYNYFPHPSNLRQSSGCVSLLIKEGYAGYGLYLSILEILRDAPNYRYNPEPKVWRYLLHGDDTDQIERVLKNYGLFDIDDDGLLFSPWLLEQLGNYSEKKAKLQEAGRRGAAKRWAAAHKGDGQAIATPSMEDGQAIAYNITQPNITEHKETTPPGDVGKEWLDVLASPGNKVPADLVDYLCKTEAEGHNVGYVAQCCRHYGVGENVFNFISEASNNADMTHPLYNKFCELVKRIQAEKFTPKQPNAFFIKKLFE